MKISKALIVTLALALPVAFVYAQGGLAGSCGTTEPCTLKDMGGVIKGALGFMLVIATMIITAMIIYSAVRIMTVKDKAAELNEAKQRLTNVVLGIILIAIAASVTGYVALLALLGVNSKFLDPIRALFSFFESGAHSVLSILATQAYAQEPSTTLPNPLGVTNLYDFLLVIIRTVMRWFVFPIIVASWFITGFKYVAAQGSPEKLLEAHKWLWWTFIGTVIIMLAEGFALALKGTVGQFFS
jgi:small-conductance mechanosensitive channel